MLDKLRLLNIFAPAVFLFAIAGTLPAQSPTAAPGSAPEPIDQATRQRSVISSPSASSDQGQTSTGGELKQIYGLQGVLIETLDGKTISSQAVDQGFNPASSIKLATALVAFQSFGAQHRF